MSTKTSHERARTAAWVGRRVERALREVELTPKEYALLALLAENTEGSSALADRLSVSRPRLTAIADRLEERGLLTRSPVPDDRRRVAHQLTAAGVKVVAAADESVAARLDELLARLDAGERAEAELGLARVAEAVAASRAEFRTRTLADDPALRR